MTVTVTPTATWELVTPDQARAYLGNAMKNRRISPPSVRKAAAQMRDKRWRDTTSQSIAFGADGRLMDGQHRLAAVVLADRPVTFLVVRGLSDDVQDVLDTGRARNAGDVLRMSGIPSANANAAAVRLLLTYDMGVDRPWGEKRKLITNEDIKKFVMTNLGVLERWGPDSQAAYRRFGGSHAAWLGGYVLIDRFVRGREGLIETQHQFVAGLTTGANVPDLDPRLALASWLGWNARPISGEALRECLFMLIPQSFYEFATGRTRQRYVIHKGGRVFSYRIEREKNWRPTGGEEATDVE